jgi:hypothetical protein
MGQDHGRAILDVRFGDLSILELAQRHPTQLETAQVVDPGSGIWEAGSSLGTQPFPGPPWVAGYR